MKQRKGIDEKTKVCSKCKINKPYSDYYKHAGHSNGIASRCIECVKAESKKPKFKNCNHCEKKFTPYTSLDKFCSASCRIESEKSKRSRNWTKEQTAKRMGKNNHAYRNGNYARGAKKTTKNERVFIRNGKEIKQEMIDDRGYIYCQWCGTSTAIKYETHHLVYRSEKPLHEHLHDKENLLVVCVQCHNDFHKHKGLRNGIVASRQLDKLFGKDVLWK